jgi:hypothetical protein
VICKKCLFTNDDSVLRERKEKKTKETKTFCINPLFLPYLPRIEMHLGVDHPSIAHAKKACAKPSHVHQHL